MISLHTVNHASARHERSRCRTGADVRRGMTLVELLMTLTIMTVLLAVSIPVIRPAFEDRTLREAARQVNAFFAGARARAAATGRPVGVWLDRKVDASNGTSYCSELFMAEAAPPFSGATINSRAQVNASTGELVLSTVDQSVLRTLLHVNEVFRIQFDFKGPRYFGRRNGAAPEFAIDISGGVPPGTEVAANNRGLAYAITRAPTKSSVAPLVLPGDAVIDLEASGLGSDGNQMRANPDPDNPLPIVVEFSPSGTVDYVFLNNVSLEPFSPVFLLLGRRSKVVPADPDAVNLSDPEISNLADAKNLWMIVGHRTGSVVTTECADTSFMPNDATAASDRIRAAREIARSMVRMGGR
jgi:prepilin-type N-terminal cleavage/methylation domain-containing protein